MVLKKLLKWKYKYLLFFFALSIAILWDSLLPGYILSLDMIFAPQIKIADLFYGLQASLLGLLGNMPLFLFLNSLSLVAPIWLVQKILLFLILFLAGVGMYNLLPVKFTPARYFAGILYVVNPFTYIRFLAGHWMVLLAYAIFPFVIMSFWEFLKHPHKKNIIKTGLLITLVGILNLHSLFLILFVFAILVLINLFLHREKINKKLSILKAVVFVGMALFVLNFYWILPTATADQTTLTQISEPDVLAFQPKAAFNFNTVFTIAAMYGFWRGGYDYARYHIPFWPLLFVVILFLAIHGAVTYFKDKKFGLYVRVFTIVGILALIFGVGASNPLTAGLFEWLFNNIFIFRAFRDSHKFVALLALTYAFLGGLGLTKLYGGWKKTARTASQRGMVKKYVSAAVLIAILAIPFVYSYTMFFGFAGQLKPTNYPDDWYKANNYFNQDPQEFNILFLPWHAYLDFGWIPNADKRLANPAVAFFDKPVIQGDNIEVGGIYSQSTRPASRYLEFLFATANKGNVKNFGALMAPLNIKYIVLAKEADWQRYNFLFDQEDLELVSNTTNLLVFKNNHPMAKIYAVDEIIEIKDCGKNEWPPEEWHALLKNNKEEIEILNYTQLSPVEYLVEQSDKKYVVFTAEYSPDWILNGQRALNHLCITNAFVSEGTQEKLSLRYERFKIYLFSYALSGAAAIVCLIYLLYHSRHLSKNSS